MSPGDYEYLCRFLKERTGLVLTPEKGYLVQSRLMPVVRRLGCANIGELVQRMRMADADDVRIAVTEAMMNNESYFFRDRIPFEHFRDTVLPDLLERRAKTRRIRIWSAAASTGQEAYSLAMQVADSPRLAGWQVDIVASDISRDALDKARLGLYSQFEVQRGLPIQMLLQHFTQVGEQWQVSAEIRKMVQFRQLNLIADSSFLGMFDLVFCRNVLIYFDRPTKVAVLERVRQVLPTDGYLILGAAETVVGLGDMFAPVPERRGLYRPTVRLSLASVRGAVEVA